MCEKYVFAVYGPVWVGHEPIRLNLGVPKYMVVWARHEGFGAKTCVIMILAVVVEKYPYGLDRRHCGKVSL